MKKFKMPDSFTILFILIIVVGVLTWIVPAGKYVYVCNDNKEAISYNDQNICPKNEKARDEIQLAIINEQEVDESLYTLDSNYEYEAREGQEQGIWAMLNAPINGFYEAVNIALFVLIVGAYINVVMQTGALTAGIGSLLKRFKGREQYLIPILMILFGIGGTTYGMAEETIAFYLLIVPTFLMAGYDAMVGVMVIMLGAGVGVLASTINPFAIGVASASAGVGIGDGIVSRLILFIILEAITIFFTMRYAAKVKEDISKSAIADIHEDVKGKLLKDQVEHETMNKHHHVILGLFAFSFVLMIISVIPWSDFGISLFTNLNDFLNTHVKILAGAQPMPELGTWSFGEFSMMFLTFAIIVGIYAKKTNLLTIPFMDAFLDGARDLLSVALIIGLARGIAVVMSAGGMDASLLYYGSEALQGLGEVPYTIATYLFYLPMSFLIPSTSGLAGVSMPVMAPLGEMIFGSDAGITYTITAYSAASGIVNIITPTSGVVMGGLALAHIPYNRWVKFITPFLVVLSVVIIILLIIGTLTGFVL